MSVYQLKTFNDVVTAIREELGISSSDTTAINRLKRDVNIIYQEVVSKKRWNWLNGEFHIQLPAYISTGTAAVTANSASVTLSLAPTHSVAGYWFAIDGETELYRVESHTAGSTSLKLAAEWTGTTNATAVYKLWTDKLPLPTDCKEVGQVWHDHHARPLTQVGRDEFRRTAGPAPRAEGKPQWYYVGDFKDARPTTSITSLPALSQRKSEGVVKSLVFASTVPTSISSKVTAGEPYRLRISGAGHSSYNGDVTITAVTTTSASNDTLVYVAPIQLQESLTAETTASVLQLDGETDFDSYRELYVYPAISSSRITLHGDYEKEVFPLENDSDEPVIPYNDRVVLLYGGLSRAWRKNGNPEESAANFQLYQDKLGQMSGKLQESMDKPRLAPSRSYLASKRRMGRGSIAESLAIGAGSGSGGNVTGVPNTVAIYDSNGSIGSASSISSTELGYLDGVTSAIQTQLDSKLSGSELTTHEADTSTHGVSGSIVGTVDTQTLSNKTIDADSNTITNIENADIKAGAAIAHSKMAALTASRAMVTDGAGVASASSVTATTLGYLDATSSIQTQLNGKAATSHSHTAADVSDFDAEVESLIIAHKPSITEVPDEATQLLLGGEKGDFAIRTDIGYTYVLVDANNPSVLSSWQLLPQVTDSANITVTPTGNLSSGSVQDALEELQTDIDGLNGSLGVATKTANYTLTASDDLILCDPNTGGADFTLTLPAAASNTGKVFRIKYISASGTYKVTLDGNGSETIDEATTRKLCTYGEAVTLVSDGSNWQVIEHKTDTPFVSFTPTGSWNTNVTYTGQWRRQGDELKVRFKVLASGAPNAASLTINIPNSASWSIDTTKVVDTAQNDLGDYRGLDAGVGGWNGNVNYSSTTAVAITYENIGSANNANTVASVSNSAPMTWANGDFLSGYFTVPMTDWWV